MKQIVAFDKTRNSFRVTPVKSWVNPHDTIMRDAFPFQYATGSYSNAAGDTVSSLQAKIVGLNTTIAKLNTKISQTNTYIQWAKDVILKHCGGDLNCLAVKLGTQSASVVDTGTLNLLYSWGISPDTTTLMMPTAIQAVQTQAQSDLNAAKTTLSQAIAELAAIAPNDPLTIAAQSQAKTSKTTIYVVLGIVAFLVVVGTIYWVTKGKKAAA